MKFTILVFSLFMSGCTVTNKFVIADAFTTYVAISDGGAELNPLLPSNPYGAAVGSMVLSYSMLHIGNKIGECELANKSVNTVKSFAITNNVMALLGASSPIAIGSGVGVAYLLNQGGFLDDNNCN